MSWIEELLSVYGVPFVTEGHSHTTPGWVNIHCPFCKGSQNYHLGINEESGACHCWRCGSHGLVDVLSRTLGLSQGRTFELLKQYRKMPSTRRKRSTQRTSALPFKLPSPNYPLSGQYKEYLENRGFDPDKLEREWGLLQTGPASYLDGISYSHRILVPIYWDRRIVSFQARDVTGKSSVRYLACPGQRELVPHQSILYGKQSYWLRSHAMIVVEGVTDVWRLGPCAAAVFGIEFRLEQVLQLLHHGDRFFVIFDNEHYAQKQARKLAIKLRALGRETHVLAVQTDPADLSQDEADYMVKQLLG